MLDSQSESDRLRDWLAAHGRSQRGLARELGVSERTMRYYCSGEQAIPAIVWLALQALADSPPGRRSPADAAS